MNAMASQIAGVMIICPTLVKARIKEYIKGGSTDALTRGK